MNIYRKLAEADPDAFLPDLASSLSNHSTEESALGQRAEALASIGEAVSIRRQLAEANPDAFLPKLANSYWSWGRILDDSGNATSTAEKFAEGLRLITPFATKLPQAYLPLAQVIASDYAKACGVAGVPPDPELTRPIDRLSG